MRIAAISDTHGHPFEIPTCDVFIHAGDMTANGSVDRQMDLLCWLEGQGQATHKIIVPGNHDLCYEKYGHNLTFDKRFKSILLINEGCEIDGKIFWGSPYTPPFYNWAFMAEEERLREMYQLIPQSVDVLITHGPPRGILDQGHDGSHAGSIELLYAIVGRNNLTVGRGIKHHVFGHLHAAGGECLENGNIGPIFYNLAAVDEKYKVRRGCTVIDI